MGDLSEKGGEAFLFRLEHIYRSNARIAHEHSGCHHNLNKWLQPEQLSLHGPRDS